MDEQKVEDPNKPPGAENTTSPSPTLTTSDGGGLERTDTVRTVGILKLRGKQDDLPRNWWFASTAVPLIAATQGPFSNVLSNGRELQDPQWELALNGVSLACGFAGNFLLLLHFVGRVRYIIALPLSIILWLLASGILIAITASVHIYLPPVPPAQLYSQGFWHAVIASITYMIGALMLVANFVGYLLGHYPQNFVLDDDQRTLILQTMMFFIWLAGGAAVFTRLEGWDFSNALYYCDVSVLTIGYGDYSPLSDAGRGFFFVYELIGITQLGLVISRLSRYMSNMSADKVIKGHQARVREQTIGRTVTNEEELRERLGLPQKRKASIGQQITRRNTLNQHGKFKVVGNTVTFKERKAPPSNRKEPQQPQEHRPLAQTQRGTNLSVSEVVSRVRGDRRQRLLVLSEEKDRFNAMRDIQDETRRFKQYYTLFVALITFASLWALGALIFMYAEEETQGLNYFDSFYFCFVTLLTVGYGDISPKSNAGKAFFIVWSLIAVPSITVLIQALSDTVVAFGANLCVLINRATNILLPEKGFLKTFLLANPNHWFTRLLQRKREHDRVGAGFQLQDPEAETEVRDESGETGQQSQGENVELEELSRIEKDSHDEHHLARQLGKAIRSVAQDLRSGPPRRYSYSEWAHFTKLIRFSSGASREAVEAREDEEGLIEWDWIGEDSPMLADITESEWVLDRLCESLDRYTKNRRQNDEDYEQQVRRRRVTGGDRDSDPEAEKS
ncbi:hypothetical protein F5Y18DRAFT_428310 [Xylariaceae sp. FL1019]|nr:hypothetical protein F5Y18DRAFT_428310 [Xylariaceae sp. FL1019]